MVVKASCCYSSVLFLHSVTVKIDINFTFGKYGQISDFYLLATAKLEMAARLICARSGM